jgi:hypothetical protein
MTPFVLKPYHLTTFLFDPKDHAVGLWIDIQKPPGGSGGDTAAFQKLRLCPCLWMTFASSACHIDKLLPKKHRCY